METVACVRKKKQQNPIKYCLDGWGSNKLGNICLGVGQASVSLILSSRVIHYSDTLITHGHTMKNGAWEEDKTLSLKVKRHTRNLQFSQETDHNTVSTPMGDQREPFVTFSPYFVDVIQRQPPLPRVPPSDCSIPRSKITLSLSASLYGYLRSCCQ